MYVCAHLFTPFVGINVSRYIVLELAKKMKSKHTNNATIRSTNSTISVHAAFVLTYCSKRSINHNWLRLFVSWSSLDFHVTQSCVVHEKYIQCDADFHVFAPWCLSTLWLQHESKLIKNENASTCFDRWSSWSNGSVELKKTKQEK